MGNHRKTSKFYVIITIGIPSFAAVKSSTWSPIQNFLFKK